MTLESPALSIFSIIKFALAAWLFSRTLPHRGEGPLRGTVAMILVVALIAGSAVFGFSMFPTLTDDLSLFVAVLTFTGELLVAVLIQRIVYDCPMLTSVFCCSMAYSLENLSSVKMS